jgi:hypothetical protein
MGKNITVDEQCYKELQTRHAATGVPMAAQIRRFLFPPSTHLTIDREALLAGIKKHKEKVGKK